MNNRFLKIIVSFLVTLALVFPSVAIEALAFETEQELLSDFETDETVLDEEPVGEEPAGEELLYDETESLLSEEESVPEDMILAEDSSEDLSDDENSESETEMTFVGGYRQIPGEDNFESPVDVGGYNYEMSLAATLPSQYMTSNLPLTRDQNPYGTCWAHTAMALSEINMGGGSLNYSELQLIYFSNHQVSDPLGGLDGDSNLAPETDYYNFGGNIGCAAVVLANWVGAINESDLPYSKATKNSQPNTSLYCDNSYAFSKDVVHLKNYYKVDPVDDRNSVKKLIMDYGAVGISFYALTNSKYITMGDKSYHLSDVYNENKAAYYMPADLSNSTNHAVTVVGWDDNFSASNFVTKPGENGAWLIRNSWLSGKNASDKNYNSYFWMSYYDKSIAHVAYAFEIESKDNYDNNYQYDGSMHEGWYTGSKFANVFTAKAKSGQTESLKAVSFATDSANVSYTINVYKGVTTGEPESGTKVSTVKGTTSYAGYYTIELPTPVDIEYGQKFSVVVSVNSGTYMLFEMTSKGVWNSTAHIDSGESYRYSGSRWVDMANEADSGFGNFRIKAFTDNGEPVTKVSFDANGGNEVKTVLTLYPNRAYGTLPTPTRRGYNFIGWFTDPSGGTQITSTSIVTNEFNHTLYAHWSAKTLALNFFPKGGECSQSYKSVTVGQPYGTLPTATRDGYDFLGWYTLADGGEKVTSGTIVSPDCENGLLEGVTTLFAHWKPHEYYLTLNRNDGTGISTYKIIEHDGVYGELPKPSRAGYTFDGWYTKRNVGEGVKVTETTTIVVNTDHSLYARWRGKAVSVNFNANGGTCSTSKKTVYAETLYGTLPIASHPYKDFAGWFTSQTGGEEVAETTLVSLNENHTVYAHWNLRQIDAASAVLESGKEVSLNDRIRLTAKPSAAKIYYTVDGSEPIEGVLGTYLYDDYEYIKVTKDIVKNNKVTVKTLVVYDGEYLPSDIATFIYTFVEDDDPGDISEEDIEELKEKYGTEKPLSEIVPDGLWIAGLSEYEYTGAAVKPNIRVYDKKKLLKLKTDYTVSYKNNVNVGNENSFNSKGVSIAPTIIVKSKGNYSGSETAIFDITPKSIEDADVTISEPASIIFNNKDQKPVPTVTVGKKKLSGSKDYSVSYCEYFDGDGDTIPAENILLGRTHVTPRNAGKYYICIRAKGNYKGFRAQLFEIGEADKVPVSKLSVKISNKTYTGDAIELNQNDLTVKYGKTVLEKDIDYTVQYPDEHKEIGTVKITIKGTGEKYIGQRTATFKITGTSISSVKVTNTIGTFSYDGLPKQQPDTMMITYKAKGEKIYTPITWVDEDDFADMADKTNVDCVVSYKNNIKAGTATMVLTGVNRFTGTLKKTFKISAYDISPAKETYDRFVVKINQDTYSYSKSGVRPEPAVTYKQGDGTTVTLTKGVDYSVSYANNTTVNNGSNIKKKPTVKITGKGNFKGQDQSCTFIIEPAGLDDADQGIIMTIADKEYSAKAGNWKNSLTVKDKNGKKLAAKTDYDSKIEYKYDFIPSGTTVLDGSSKLKVKPSVARSVGDTVADKDIVPAGTRIKVTIKGTGINYFKETNLSTIYRVVASDINKLKASVPTFKYTGKEIRISKYDITWKSGKNVLSDVTFDIVSYNNNINKGKASVTVRGSGNYGGTKTITYNIGTKGFLWWFR